MSHIMVNLRAKKRGCMSHDINDDITAGLKKKHAEALHVNDECLCSYWSIE